MPRHGGQPVVEEISAGGVLYRRRGDEIDVALIQPRHTTVWALPKGLIEPGEDAAAAARREVREETGLEGREETSLGETRYWYRAGPRLIHKTVHFFLFAHTGGDLSRHDQEVEAVRWAPLSEAGTVLSYAGEREVLGRAEALLRPAPAG